MQGRLLNQYELRAPLGRGGMGVVYRALDRELGREVAIKLLPAELAADPERLARLEREARTLAAVNDPGIATLYGLGSAEVDGETVRFLAMELIEGEDLAARLGRLGALDVGEAMALGRQIAAALETAHEAGIVHRDLKPANVRVTPRDRAVVVDFGLARPTGTDPAGSASQVLSQSPTAAAPTVAGTILGTAPYMSPEQARGKPVDRRTDIWAFGCVLYEMLTGARAFRGETVSDTLAAVLREDPDWGRLPTATPARVRALLRRCLDRDPDTRLRDIGEARIALSAGVGGEDAEVSVPVAVGGRGLAWRVAAPTGVGLLLLGISVGWWLDGGGGAPTAGPQRWVFESPAESRFFETQAPAISPDGRTLAFAVREGPMSRIYLQRLDEFEPTPVAGTERGESPFFSPDGQWLGFGIESQLCKVPIEGGTPTLLLAGGFWDPTAHWHRPDEIVLGGSSSVEHRGVLRVAADGSGSTVLTEIADETDRAWQMWPQVLDDGSVLLGVQTRDRGQVVRFFPDSGELEPLAIEAEPPAVYLPEGRLVYSRNNALWGVAYDLSRGPVADPVELVSGVSRDEWTISPGGVLAYLFARSRGGRVVAVDRQGRVEVLLEEVREYDWPRLSPDGRRFALGHVSPAGAALWVYEIGSGRRLQLQAPGGNGEPTWSPDGRRLAYSTEGTAQVDLHWQLADGSGVSELLHHEPFDQWPTSFSPDGRQIAFYGWDGEDDASAIWLATVGDAASGRRVLGGPGTQRGGAFSPDGRWFAYASTESGRSEVYLRPYPDLESRRFVVSSEGGVDPHWSSDARELFYRNGDAMFVVGISSNVESPVGAPEELFRGPFHFQRNGDQSFDVFPDGLRFLMIQPTPESRRELRVASGFLPPLDE